MSRRSRRPKVSLVGSALSRNDSPTIAHFLAVHVQRVDPQDFDGLRTVVKAQSALLNLPYDEEALREAWQEWWMESAPVAATKQ